MGDMTKENGSIVTAADEVRVMVSKWDDYRIEDNKGQKYICGYDREGKEREIGAYKELNSREYLDSLIVLSFDVLHNKPKEDTIMKKWCEKYGFPFLGSGLGSATVRGYGCENEFYGVYGPKVGCSTWGFHCALRSLQDAFLAASALFPVNIGLLNDFENYYEGENLFDVSSTQESFRLAIARPSITTSIDFSSNPPRLYWRFGTPIAAAYYHLTLLAIAPDGFLVKRCECCNSLFVSERSNKKYCINCNPVKKYKKTYKGKKGGNCNAHP